MKRELIDETNKAIIFSNKVYFPGAVWVGSYITYLKTIAEMKCLFLTASSVYKILQEPLREILVLGEGNIIFVDEEPTIQMQEAFLQKLDHDLPDIVLAIGGGSVLDLAKSLRVQRSYDLVVIPTTPCTGTETNPYAVLRNRDGQKTAIYSKRLLPDAVILDAGLLATIEKRQFGYFLMDGMAHCIEALVSKRASAFSDSFALEGFRLFRDYYQLLDLPYPKSVLEKIQTAGFFGGCAQGMASVGLVHAFAHYFGGRYRISHARAVAMFLRDVIAQNSSRTDRYKKLEQVSLKTSLEAMISSAMDFFDLSDEQIPVEHSFRIDEAAEAIQKDVCSLTNPVRWRNEEVIELIKKKILISNE
ncbi:MAG: iron-containing alcohol dehydrogenase [Candidatus Wildermuthbacteria bacterium]|nr:iron-containing alcohol dehydrogenase [Candidatus Wildermuthbacteria bacterium]